MREAPVPPHFSEGYRFYFIRCSGQGPLALVREPSASPRSKPRDRQPSQPWPCREKNEVATRTVTRCWNRELLLLVLLLQLVRVLACSIRYRERNNPWLELESRISSELANFSNAKIEKSRTDERSFASFPLSVSVASSKNDRRTIENARFDATAEKRGTRSRQSMAS